MKRWGKNNKIPKICNVTGKVSFESEATASRRLRNYQEITRYYFCEECGGYHLTSQPLPYEFNNVVVGNDDY